MEKSLENKISFYFTSSRSYEIPNYNIKIGALKAYPTSVDFNKKSVNKIINELKMMLDYYENNKVYTNLESIQDNMVYAKNQEDL